MNFNYCQLLIFMLEFNYFIICEILEYFSPEKNDDKNHNEYKIFRKFIEFHYIFFDFINFSYSKQEENNNNNYTPLEIIT